MNTVIKLFKNKMYLLFWLALGFLPIVGSTLGQPSEWFWSLNFPVFNPPAWIFGVVWPILYILIGLACFTAYVDKDGYSESIGDSIYLFLCHLILNTAWSYVFFGLESIVGGLMVITALLFTVALWIKMLNDEKALLSSILLIPYFLWILFATLLNLNIYLLN